MHGGLVLSFEAQRVSGVEAGVCVCEGVIKKYSHHMRFSSRTS